MGLLKFLHEGLMNTDSGLGDRSKYVGASDIGNCLKKSYLSKTVGESFDLRQLLIFERGHVAEGIVAKALKAKGIEFSEQVEVVGGNGFVKGHIDFTVRFPQECVVIECKSISSPLPDGRPRENWILQVQLQLGLLQERTRRPCRGYILAINLNSGEAEEFPVPFNETLYRTALNRAETLWKSVISGDEPEGEISDLCPYCSFKNRCSTLRSNGAELPEEVASMIRRYKELQAAEKEAKEIKENLKAFMEAAGLKKGITEENTLLLSHRSGREMIDIEMLKEEFPEAYNACKKRGNGYSVLKIA